LYVELGREFHVAPWVFENAPFRWYRRLRKWFFWKREKEWWDLPLDVRNRIELEKQADERIVGGWEDEMFRGEFT
jgi:hypothetical protein